MDAQPGTPQSANANIETVVRMEQQFLDQRNLKDRIGDAIANAVGTMTYVILHVALVLAWVVVNAGWVPFVPPFDPYPYVLFTMLVSMEGVFLTIFILMKQNRMSRRADHRDHLNLQIDLLAEKEVTKMLQLQHKLLEHFGIDDKHDVEAQELSRHTAVEDLAQQLERQLPNE